MSQKSANGRVKTNELPVGNVIRLCTDDHFQPMCPVTLFLKVFHKNDLHLVVQTRVV